MKTKCTEADLEARMHAVMLNAFPFLTTKSLKHQTHFSVKLGHTPVKIDGSTTHNKLSGRSDIIVLLNEKPIALLELKREDVSITEDDKQQGLSYARLTTPTMAPLLILSNGKDTKIYISYSGEEWKPTERTEVELQQRLKNVGILADSNLKDAVETLMGSNQQHWIGAFHSISKRLIEERTGGWSESTPFVHNFLLPRRSTTQISHALNEGVRSIVVYGPPLSGKSNVLRELVESEYMNSVSVAVLIIEPNEVGIFDTIAHLLSSELSWSVSNNDARTWLRTISNIKDTRLVLALDGGDPAFASVLADLNELASTRFGASLHIVITVDDSALDCITKKSNGREKTAVGRAAQEIPLLPLDNEEFYCAEQMLMQQRILVTPGGESVKSLREPWILRALVPTDVTELPAESHQYVRIPPLMNIESLNLAAKSIELDDEAKVLLSSAASAILDQYLESKGAEAILHGISTFAVDRVRLEVAVGNTGIKRLRQCGFIKPGINWARQSVWFVRVPVLVASHLATILSERMRSWGEPKVLAKRLIAIASKLPLGDIIVASALVERITGRPDINPLDIVDALLNQSPQTSSLSPGSEFAIVVEGRILHTKVINNRKLRISRNASTKEIDLDTDDLSDILMQPGGWLILSHIAALPLAVEIPGESEVIRLDEPLLTELAQAKIILSRPDDNQDFKEIAVHDIPGHGKIVCHEAGIVEPITWALVKYFINRGQEASPWIEESIARQSLPMLARIHIALRHTSQLYGAHGDWAREILEKKIKPAISASLMHHL